jgi:general secretion pathway protein M
MTASALPTGLRGRLLALALAFLAIAAVYLLIAAPLLNLYAQREARLEQEGMLVPHLEAAAAALPTLRARLAALRTAARTSKVTLDGASDAIASANLEGRIEGLAGKAGVTIGSTESLPVATMGGYRRIGLRLVLSGPYENLINLLAAIEAAAPPLIVDDLQIHGVLQRPGMPQRGVLDAALDVYGFRSNRPPVAEKP